MQTEHYADEDGDDLFGKSVDELSPRARRRVLAAIERMEDGNFGDWKSLGSQLREHRIHAEGGLRIYFSIQNDEIVLLLISGVKSSQDRDIRIARERLLNHETRKK